MNRRINRSRLVLSIEPPLAPGGAGGAAPAPAPEPAKPTPLSEDQAKLVANADLFKARLEEEKSRGTTAAYKALGFKDEAEAKAAIEAAKKIADEKKTDAEKTKERVTALEGFEKQAKEYGATIATYAEQEFKALPVEAQKLVTAQAGEDAHQRLKTIAALRESGVLAKLTTPTAEPAKANSRAGGAAPVPTGNQKKHARDMTPEEFKAFEAESLARHSKRS